MKAEVKLRRYALPSVKGEGWAIIVLGSDGYFSAVSDWGNYAFIWGAHGCMDFRQFLLMAGRDWDYFVTKLSPHPGGRVYDGEATVGKIRKHIIELRRERRIDAEKARTEWEHASAADDGSDGYAVWWLQTELEDVHDLGLYTQKPDQQCKAFVETVIAARLVPILRAELEAEGLVAA